MRMGARIKCRSCPAIWPIQWDYIGRNCYLQARLLQNHRSIDSVKLTVYNYWVCLIVAVFAQHTIAYHKEQIVSYERKDGFYLSPGSSRGADGPSGRGRGSLRGAGDVHPMPPDYTELQILEAIPQLMAFLREGRELYYPAGQPLTEEMISAVGQFFSPALLASARVVKLSACRLPNPSFYPELQAKGFNNLPDFSHMTSVTFLDAVVFTMKAHAFALDGRYAKNKNESFSVEEEVRQWAREGRY